jgi:ribosomal protein L39E
VVTPAKVASMPAKEMPAEAARMPATTTNICVAKTRLAEANHQNTHGKMPPSNSRMPGKLHITKVVAREQTVTMTVTWPWRKPAIAGRRTQRVRGKWDLGSEIATWHQMMHASSLTESICRRYWRSKAYWDPSALDPDHEGTTSVELSASPGHEDI